MLQVSQVQNLAQKKQIVKACVLYYFGVKVTSGSSADKAGHAPRNVCCNAESKGLKMLPVREPTKSGTALCALHLRSTVWYFLQIPGPSRGWARFNNVINGEQSHGIRAPSLYLPSTENKALGLRDML